MVLWLAAQPALATVSPILECVVQQPGGYVAWYGYKSFASKTLNIPVGAFNRFVPSPIDRGQPTSFLRGRNGFVFSVPFASDSISWKLSLLSATASAGSTRCPALDLQPAELPSGELNEPYQVQLTATGGVGPKTFTVSGLPPGLEATAAGLISGAPTDDGTFLVHASVQDQIGQIAEGDYELVVFTAVVGCNAEPTEPELVVGGESVPDAALNREGPSSCEPAGVLLRTGADGEMQFTELAKPPGDIPATLTITWEPTPATAPPPWTQIDLDGDGGDPPTDVQWCEGDVSAPIVPEGLTWCLVSQIHSIVDGQLLTIEVHFGSGDPLWTRR
jgi:hypothetical protein